MMPLVSCVMPTADRQKYIGVAIKCFQEQTYPDRELIILDDGKVSAEGLIPIDPLIRYYRYALFSSLGQKRNAACDLARGEIVCNWDDDDWYSPSRILDQVSRLMGSGKAVTGYHRFWYWDEVTRSAYEYFFNGVGEYAAGSSQCYLKQYWVEHHYKFANTAEDTDFSFQAKKLNQLTSTPAGGLMVARGHAGNSWRHPFGSVNFPHARATDLPEKFRKDAGIIGG